MKIVTLSSKAFQAARAPFDAGIPDAEATDAFWSSLDTAREALRKHLSRFGPEGSAWELPGHEQRCRVLYAYLYADGLYTPELLPGIAAVLPQDGQRWCAQLECFSDARRLPNGNPLCLGWAAIIDGTFYTSKDYKDLIAYGARLGLDVAKGI